MVSHTKRRTSAVKKAGASGKPPLRCKSLGRDGRKKPGDKIQTDARRAGSKCAVRHHPRESPRNPKCINQAWKCRRKFYWKLATRRWTRQADAKAEMDDRRQQASGNTQRCHTKVLCDAHNLATLPNHAEEGFRSYSHVSQFYFREPLHAKAKTPTAPM